jgi:ribosomal protein S18 acetylase RimI-like enzyme
VSDEISLRESRPDDAEAAVAIALAAWAPLHDEMRALFGSDLYLTLHPRWQERKAEQVRAALRGDAGARAAVALVGDRIVGFVTFYLRNHDGIGEISNNAVHPDFQGRGIGPAMYRHVFAALQRAGVRFVAVSTGGDPFHAPARRAYEKVGFATSFPGVTYYCDLQDL